LAQQGGVTALIDCIVHNRTEIVSILLDHGVDVNLRNKVLLN